MNEQGNSLQITSIHSADLAVQRAEDRLQSVKTVAEANNLAASAELLKNIIKRANLGYVAQNHAAAVAIKARRAAGEMVMLLERKHGVRQDGSPEMSPLQQAALETGLSKATLMRWQKLARDLTDEMIDAAEAEATRDNRELTTRDVWAKARTNAAPNITITDLDPENVVLQKKLDHIFQLIWKLPDPRESAASLKDLKDTQQWQDAIHACRWLQNFIAEFKADDPKQDDQTGLPKYDLS